MGKKSNGLTVRFVETVTKPGRYADGNGLYLVVKKSGAKSWVLLYTFQGRRREMGLGGYPAVPLATARRVAATHKETLVSGIDPLSVAETPEVPTFREMRNDYIASHGTSWRNAKHRRQWESTLATYAGKLDDKRVDEITTANVLAVLKPVWLKIPETASRLRGRIEAVLDAAKAQGFRTGENPAAWRGNLKHLLPRPVKLARGHHAAMPFEDVPDFVARLRRRTATAALALEFIILTAARSGEVLGATWTEIDLATGLWTVPRHRMKSGREHRVPLSGRAIEILEVMSARRQSDAPDALIFPGGRRGRPLSGMAGAMLLRRMGHADVTTHGFRSSFRDWAGETTAVQREVIEAALAHIVGDATERAYRRGDALDKRRQLMEAWTAFVSEPAERNKVDSASAQTASSLNTSHTAKEHAFHG